MSGLTINLVVRKAYIIENFLYLRIRYFGDSEDKFTTTLSCKPNCAIGFLEITHEQVEKEFLVRRILEIGLIDKEKNHNLQSLSITYANGKFPENSFKGKIVNIEGANEKSPNEKSVSQTDNIQPDGNTPGETAIHRTENVRKKSLCCTII